MRNNCYQSSAIVFIATLIAFTGCNHRDSTDNRPITTTSNSRRIDDRMQVILPREGVLHIVQDGETLASICKAYVKSTEAILKVNGLQSPKAIHPGYRLFIPGATKAINAATPSKVDTTDRTLPALVAYSGTKSSGLIWPVKGKTRVNFRQQDFFARSDGMSITTPFGAPVWAAQNGVVAYQDDDFLSMGKVVIIAHTGGLYTLYGNLMESKVRTGQSVAQGAAIARAGTSGRTGKPQLHFRVYKGTGPVNPVSYLR